MDPQTSIGTFVLVGNLLYPPRLFARLFREQWYTEPLTAWLATLQLTPHTALLEVGSGPGLLAAYAVRTYACTATGVDKSSSMLRYARRLERKQLRYVRGDASALPFPDNTFDVVIGSSLLNIVPDRTTALREMLRVTKPEGSVSCLVPNATFTPARAQDIIAQGALRGFSRAALLFWSNNARRMSLDDLTALIKSCAIKQDHVTYQHYFHDTLTAVTIRKDYVPHTKKHEEMRT
jgi:SAM-dependent methyltransferase